MSDNNLNDSEKEKNNPESNNDEINESAAARRLRVLEGDEKTDEDKTDVPLAKGNWFENFWYHYKWRTIIISIFTVFMVVGIFQLVTREKPDIYLLYAGPTYINADANQAICSAFKQVMSEDFNGDGEKGLLFTDITYMNNEQIQQVVDEAEAEGVNVALDLSANAAALKKFNMEIFAGESVICLLDPGLYAEVRDAGGFLKLTEVLGEDFSNPDITYDESGIIFSKTDFAKFFGDSLGIPEDTILCIRRVSTMSVFKGKSKIEKIHSYHVKMFSDIVNFEIPEGFES